MKSFWGVLAHILPATTYQGVRVLVQTANGKQKRQVAYQQAQDAISNMRAAAQELAKQYGYTGKPCGTLMVRIGKREYTLLVWPERQQ